MAEKQVKLGVATSLKELTAWLPFFISYLPQLLKASLQRELDPDTGSSHHTVMLGPQRLMYPHDQHSPPSCPWEMPLALF